MKSIIRCSYSNLAKLLHNKQTLSDKQKTLLRYSIDNYDECWRIWNKVRWDAAMDSRGVIELKEFFGENFVPYHDSSWALSREWNSKSRTTKKSIEEFYQHTSNYIYNSVIFFESGDRIDLEPYFNEIKEKYNIKSVTDFGCGVGNDGLMMLKNGCKVRFVDFNSPTLDFLKWRLQKRNIPQHDYLVKDVETPILSSESTDMFWSIDVIEHMKNPLEIFSHIFHSTKVIAYFTDADDKAGGRHPFHFKIRGNELATQFYKRGYKEIKHDILKIWIKNELPH